MDNNLYGKVIAKNLRRIAFKRQKTQADISRDLNINQSTLSSWMSGRRIPKMDKIDLLCDYLKCSRDEIISDYAGTTPARSIKIPVYGSVAAGVPLEMIQDIRDDEEIPEAMARGGKAFFALRIAGDSMAPRMVDGDVVIVQRQDDVESGDIAIVTVNSSDATCKKVVKTADGLMLMPLNPAYTPMFYTAAQCRDLPVAILGKVVELRGKF